MNRTPDTWIADGYDVKQRGGRMIAYCGPHHTPAHEYPISCRLQDEENARWIAAAPARIAELERDNAAKDAYIARLLKAGDGMADVTTERRRMIWREAVLSLPNGKVCHERSELAAPLG